MKKHLVLLAIICSSIISFANDPAIQQIIHLLDYLANDYPSAVRDGKVVNIQEFAEMKEFANKIQQQVIATHLDSNKNISSLVNQLPAMVEAKSNTIDLKKVCNNVKNNIIESTGYITFPKNWPDYSNAVSLYSANCARCHGANGEGNGVDAMGLDPAPANFLDAQRMQNISPLQAFNTIRLGVDGTAMKGFEQLTENQVWDLAFYVSSMYHNRPDSVIIQERFNKYVGQVSLDQLAKNSDNELKVLIKDTNELSIASIRLGRPKEQKENFLQVAKNKLSASYQAYINNDIMLAEQEAVSAYLQGIEPIEVQVKSLNPRLKDRIEKAMMLVRSDIAKKVPASRLQADIKSCYVLIDEIQVLLNSEKKSNSWSFFMSFSIIMREALEAVLILIIIINIIKTVNVKKALLWVHLGWIAALVIGAITWFFSEKLLEIGMERIEFFEGVVSLIAVIIVIYIGFWMHQHTEINKWKAFVNDKITALIKNENYKGLALLSFVVVGREVFECVLFLSALGAQKGADSQIHLSILLGVVAALLVVIVLSYLLINYTQTVPVRKLLRVSSFILGALAVILIGKAFHSFQETGHIPIHSIIFDFKIELLGIYPTLESILAQAVLSALVIYLLFIHKPKVSK